MGGERGRAGGGERGWRCACRAWWLGATQPSLAGLVATLTVTLALAIAAAIVVSPARFDAEAAAYLAISARDDYPHVTAAALALARSRPAGPVVVLLGASSNRESISTPDELAGSVAGRCGVCPDVHNLATGNQSFWEMVALCDYLPRRFDGVVLLGVNPARFHRARERLATLIDTPRFGFTSRAMDAEATRAGIYVPIRSGVYALENFQFLWGRRAYLRRNCERGPIPRLKGGDYIGRPPTTRKRWLTAVAWVRDGQPTYDAGLELCRGALERLVARLRARGRVTPVLLEAPVNPRFAADVGIGHYAHHARQMRRLASTLGIPYWDLNEAAGLTEADFFDWVHFRTVDAKQRYTNELAVRLAELLGPLPDEEAH